MSTQGRAQFTPGPWVVNENDTGMSDDGTIVNQHGLVIVSSVYGQTTEIAAANATLIAAAPAMYEALQEIEDQLDQFTAKGQEELGLRPALMQIRAALAQAEGRQA